MVKQDWHPAEILCALKKTGTSLAELSREHGLSSGTLQNALSKQYPRAEKIIADRLNIEPSEIWPSRYFKKDGTSIKRVIKKPI
ncbi:TPA: helix-turn-helix domain-containing protein [Salmonella enterica subsp. salamae serovar 35:g,m,s,t:-]|uniref:helix-turn-helix domain-containing protein n=1 Tax=Salmonella enterica TaxID=28901 RepID=UPI000B7BE3F7|nr:helix-turn-helix transcriptional regulator [Salmonella enterica]ECF5900157.1 transcriptional regulator [Salmonella enterica subsp. salamae]ECG8508841.1 transcriptional regulator [Salmonella enterica subsp. diarizonae]HCA3405498.1 helix-turn-helix domain-containing protein [Salmonella enterica subsp. salamae serovar 35:g,m,s,t:-]ASO12767.1 regulator [Salmonella enterica subsp. salamae serovar 57:z29:z42]ECJ2966352.1 transcriptional regulator [Salmonella enterica subsp. salamae]